MHVAWWMPFPAKSGCCIFQHHFPADLDAWQLSDDVSFLVSARVVKDSPLAPLGDFIQYTNEY